MAFVAGFLAGVAGTMGAGILWAFWLMRRSVPTGANEKQQVRETASAVLNAEDPARRTTIHARP